jgi:hypothetical protein
MSIRFVSIRFISIRLVNIRFEAFLMFVIILSSLILCKKTGRLTGRSS